MKTDSLFYKLFTYLPETFFELISEPKEKAVVFDRIYELSER